MRSWRLRSRVLAIAILLKSAFGQDLDRFDKCKIRVNRILNGTETFGTINNETITPFLYTGPVGGMNPDYARTSRNSFTTLTTQGCKAICEDPIDWYWQTNVPLTLSIISNWILPIIALLAALPYDSLHKKNAGASWGKGKFLLTAGALLNWLGSPQTALTATLFNIHQMGICLGETLPSGDGISGSNTLVPSKNDAYYVLSCIGQFKHLNVAGRDPRFLPTLIYGLFNPLFDINNGKEVYGNGTGLRSPPDQRAEQWTTALLKEMAFQLRMLRRRGVYPTFLNITVFFIAYGVSIVLAFGDLGGRTTAHSLAFGIMISWLPLLVLFAVVDRNPVSADRSRILISRWMWNVEAVKQWVDNPNRPQHPNWWPPTRDEVAQNQGTAQQTGFENYISDFVGQGRQIGYNGLPYAVAISVYNSSETNRTMRSLQTITDELIRCLNGRRPGSWWALAVTSLLLVWLEIGMAFMISFNIPTVGIGCRSLSYLIYGGLSSFPWMIHLLPSFGGSIVKNGLRWLSTLFTLLSTGVLCFIIFAAFSGVLKNCTCRGGFVGYVDFEDAQFYRNPNHFDVAKWWRGAAIVGALPMVFSSVVAVFLLGKLKPLWQASEVNSLDAEVDMQWLR